ncbi:MAG: universal stress protein, partial [Brevibacterium aurantiacum]
GRVLTRGSEYDPAEQILDAAAEVGAELIVLGTRKRTPVGKFLLGSTIQRVILEAVCPVLCVKASR